MVKLGFIVEGDNEKAILQSSRFRDLLNTLAVGFVDEVINAKGSGNLLPEYLADQVNALQTLGATHILILTDQEDAPCISSVKWRIDPENKHLVVIAVKAIEAWFLADTAAISAYMKVPDFFCEHPERIFQPFQFIKKEKFERTGRGVNDKKQLCSRMLLSGFSLQNAAAHPYCPSARYFLEKLKTLAK